MQVLLLSPTPEKLLPLFEASDDAVTVCTERLTGIPQADYIVSYGYRHIIREPVLSAFKAKIVNLHISYLPWNRGADPNFWSWFDHTPKGVTIHRIDDGIDTGDIIAQVEMDWETGHFGTLALTYEDLHRRIVKLFASVWPKLRDNRMPPAYRQQGLGSFHQSSEIVPWFGALSKGWDTSVREVACLMSKAEHQASAACFDKISAEIKSRDAPGYEKF